MNSEKPQYDAKLGGSVMLDTNVSTFRYAAGALEEIKDLLKDIQQSKNGGTKLVFQSLPKQMRRRAMSHHPKRLPRKYRNAHIAQMAKSGKSAKLKRPSRKYRRRPKNLMKEYIRRQRKYVWLETHLWHAKRFHMVDRWGYRLPYVSCDKTYRACYRATRDHCLLQDISYYACIEMEGNPEDIVAGFRKLTSGKCGLSIGALTYMTGRREGSVVLFKEDRYPFDALGKVSFMWRPLEGLNSLNENKRDEKRTLWLWIHPSMYTLVLIEILRVFNLKTSNKIRVPIIEDDVVQRDEEALKGMENHKSPIKGCKSNLNPKKQLKLKFMTKLNAYERIKKYKNNDTGLELTELKDTLNRFRLWGPLSQAILSKVFKCKEFSDKNTKLNWFEQIMTTNPKAHEIHLKQKAYWDQCQQLSSPSDLLSNFILGLNVEDPRLHRPKKKSKAIPLESEKEGQPIDQYELLMQAEPILAQSSIWESSLRNRLCEEMLSTEQYCKMRAKKAAVPGKTCQFELDLQPIPVLLIQRPGSQNPKYKRLGMGSGWDIIAPSGYGISLWLTFIMCGARPGGLRESETLARELGTELYLPDECTGKIQATERYCELKNKYFRLPPNRRNNYRKLAIVSPFRAPFPQLIRDWQKECLHKQTSNGIKVTSFKSFYVVRDRNILEILNSWLYKRKHLPDTFLENENCLIQMKFKMKSRGNPDDYSLVCIPTLNDFKKNLRVMKKKNHNPIYIEPILDDPDEKERKNLRTDHKRLLKRLRARRVREKHRLQETALKRVHIRNANTSHLRNAYALKMQSLWLPENIDTLYTVRKQCTREVFGYITSSNFTFTEAVCSGIGYVTFEGLKELMQVCKSIHLRQPMCLVRPTKSRNYRFATFQLNLEP